jgi:hypothetical protein
MKPFALICLLGTELANQRMQPTRKQPRAADAEALGVCSEFLMAVGTMHYRAAVGSRARHPARPVTLERQRVPSRTLAEVSSGAAGGTLGWARGARRDALE